MTSLLPLLSLFPSPWSFFPSPPLPSLPPPSPLPSSQSSIGDVSTLRTKLQARRATLNAEIEKEDKFHQGSKRLVRASIDHKTRDQAMLEANFAESKIKALQAELAKINSSLPAYQHERYVYIILCERHCSTYFPCSLWFLDAPSCILLMRFSTQHKAMQFTSFLLPQSP